MKNGHIYDKLSPWAPYVVCGGPDRDYVYHMVSIVSVGWKSVKLHVCRSSTIRRRRTSSSTRSHRGRARCASTKCTWGSRARRVTWPATATSPTKSFRASSNKARAASDLIDRRCVRLRAPQLAQLPLCCRLQRGSGDGCHGARVLREFRLPSDQFLRGVEVLCAATSASRPPSRFGSVRIERSFQSLRESGRSQVHGRQGACARPLHAARRCAQPRE